VSVTLSSAIAVGSKRSAFKLRTFRPPQLFRGSAARARFVRASLWRRFITLRCRCIAVITLFSWVDGVLSSSRSARIVLRHNTVPPATPNGASRGVRQSRGFSLNFRRFDLEHIAGFARCIVVTKVQESAWSCCGSSRQAFGLASTPFARRLPPGLV